MKTTLLLTAALAASTLYGATAQAQEIVEITNSLTSETLTHNKLFVPEGDGPFPAVVIMHGVGGLWSNDNVEGEVMSGHFEEWGVTFQNAGYVALFVDSFTPRGQVEFRNKRPSDKPSASDAAGSDRHVRPTDAYAALAYLRTRTDVIDDRVALMGFSHGGQSTLAAMVSPSITQHKTSWKVNHETLQANGTYKNIMTTTAAPYTVNPADGFRTAVAYYPGCGFYSYFGSSSSTASKLYMPYAPTLMIHGDEDALHNADYFTTALVGKSASHANFLNLPVVELPIDDANGQPVSTNNPMHHLVVEGLDHSFDELDENEAGHDDMITVRAQVLAWLEEYLEN